MAKPKRVAKQTKKPTRKPDRKPPRPRAPAAPPPADTPEPESTLPALRTATPERGFAARFKPPAPSPPLPAGRRAIFVDVENSSRADHVSRVLDHLAIDRQERRVDLIAVGNWRVIGADSARLLARRGAHLVHSAPSTGVKDWSDLRIAVSAGVWLGSARPGDLIEIISDDRAFDAVGDVAALLGVEYRRLSHRGLTGASSIVEPVEPEAPAPRERRQDLEHRAVPPDGLLRAGPGHGPEVLDSQTAQGRHGGSAGMDLVGHADVQRSGLCNGELGQVFLLPSLPRALATSGVEPGLERILGHRQDHRQQ